MCACGFCLLGSSPWLPSSWLHVCSSTSAPTPCPDQRLSSLSARTGAPHFSALIRRFCTPWLLDSSCSLQQLVRLTPSPSVSLPTLSEFSEGL
ncbi:hypothetical protein GOP47_0016625 [Adiantum capillus-veneris]|uniref:Secreted protein n=1 Tax=Adiantum capillus-veneris TaxID=13818 RepID=A0A9D4UI57_ADICA|nr:hypothetical protein GOP47_0016625 [Adiantum capillus-veneris]